MAGRIDMLTAYSSMTAKPDAQVQGLDLPVRR
jgi:hypothetical protein